MDKVNDILDFWFEGLADDIPIDKDSPSIKKWFIKDANFDRKIVDNFETDFVKAAQGDYKDWEATPRGRLALIILFDQFTRNMYRNTAKMFEADPLALDLTLRTIREKVDKDLQLIERVFLYLPLEHAEDLKMQLLCVQCYEHIVKESQDVNPQNTFYFEYNLEYAHKHYDIIEKFGRFPHRNKMLNRESTPEEIEFLQKPGSSF